MEYPTAVVQVPKIHSKVLCVPVEKMYLKISCDAKDEEVINCVLENNREKLFAEKDEEQVMADTVPLSMDAKPNQTIRKMLQKKEFMGW